MSKGMPKGEDELDIEALRAELARIEQEIEQKRREGAEQKAALYAAADPSEEELAAITRQTEVATAGLRAARHRLEVRLLDLDKTPWEQRQAEEARQEWAAQEQAKKDAATLADDIAAGIQRGYGEKPAKMVAIQPSQPLMAVYRSGPDGGRDELPVYGFTAAGSALVLDPGKHHLVLAWDTDRGMPVEIVAPDRRDLPVTGPFTPAPPGQLTVILRDGTRIPVPYLDVHGRPVIVDPASLLGYLEVADALDDFDRIEHTPSP